MSDSPDPKHELVASRVMARLSGFIQGIGLSAHNARQIVDQAIADDTTASEHDIEAKTRAWMLIALA